MYYNKGYIVSVDKELRNVDFMFEDNIIYIILKFFIKVLPEIAEHSPFDLK